MEVIDYFRGHFGFTPDQSVAILGAHTLGQAFRKNSGYDGEDGWVVNKTVLGKWEPCRGLIILLVVV